MKRTTLIFSICALICLPAVAHAADLPNPLGTNIDDPQDLALRILQVFLGFLALIAVIMFIYGGFMMLTSAGNSDRVKKAKNTLVWAAAGVIVILGSYSFLRFIFSLFVES